MSVPGQMYAALASAALSGGHTRSLYSPDAPLSRRGLLTRADRRARELAKLGVRAGQVVALSAGNVAELFVLLFATSKLGAVSLLLDVGGGPRVSSEVTDRLSVRAVIRRPAGDMVEHEYGAGHRVRSRRRLANSRLAIDLLEPDPDLPGAPPRAEVGFESCRPGGHFGEVFRSGEQLLEIGTALASALGLGAGARLVTHRSLGAVRTFELCVLAWLCSEAKLEIGDATALFPARHWHGEEQLFVVDTVDRFLELARAIRGSPKGAAPRVRAVIPATVLTPAVAREIRGALGLTPFQVLHLEELGPLAIREAGRGAAFAGLRGISLVPGESAATGGQEVLAQLAKASTFGPGPTPGAPGSAAGPDGLHTGYVGRFSKGTLAELEGRNDGLVELDGHRACLDGIEDALLEHRRLTWVRATLESTTDVHEHLVLEYTATGSTEVEDLEEHAIRRLRPHMVPRLFRRRGEPREDGGDP